MGPPPQGPSAGPAQVGREEPHRKKPPSWEGLAGRAALSSGHLLFPTRQGRKWECAKRASADLPAPSARPELSLRCHPRSPCDSVKLASWEQRPGGDLV